MTTPTAESPAPAAPAPDGVNGSNAGAAAAREAILGQSFGAIAWERFRSHRQALVGSFIILFMAFCAVFAPLLANHLPFYVEAQRPDLYDNAFGIVWFDLLNAAQHDDVPFDATLLANVREKLVLMRDLLSEKDAAAFSPVADRLREFLDATPIDAAAVRGLLKEQQDRFDSFNEELDYATVSGYPVFRDLKASEVFFMLLYLGFVVGVPLRRRLGGIRGALGLALLIATFGGLLWRAAVPPRHDPTDYKQLEADGFVSRIVYPPVPFGENENIFSDAKMKPCWMQVGPAEARAAQQRRYEAALAEYRQASREASGADGERVEPKLEDFAPRPTEIRPYWRTGDDGLPIELEGRPLFRNHWLGADATGRDLLTRMIFGARIAMSIGIVAVAIYISIGVFIGAAAGYFGRWIDLAVSRFIEIIICFPTFFLVLIIISFIGPSIFWVMVVIGITGWTSIARLTRGEFLRVGTLDFVHAVRGAGGSHLRIITRHILPNAIQPVLVSASFGIASAILIESALSYLGFGVRPPQASWGVLLHDAQDDVKGMWWLTLFPGMAIFTTVTAFNLCGEALRDALDPKLIGGE